MVWDVLFYVGNRGNIIKQGKDEGTHSKNQAGTPRWGGHGTK